MQNEEEIPNYFLKVFQIKNLQSTNNTRIKAFDYKSMQSIKMQISVIIGFASTLKPYFYP